MMFGQKRRGPRLIAISTILTIFLILYLKDFKSLDAYSSLITHQPRLKCPESPLPSSVAVILRTGATESQEKLAIHFSTILSCIPDILIYSDFTETIFGHQTHDILSDVNEDIKSTTPEFTLYNHLRAHGREGLSYETLYGSGPGGAQDNPGWKLDKWKFLPMVDRALRDRPEAKWYVFVEGDTYLLYQNMVAYLSKFDADIPYYLGKHMYINGIFFGHGGSGFALSRPAVEKVSRHWLDHLTEYDELTQREWAGDAILGKAIKDAGIDMFSAFPHLQGDSLTTIDWNVSKLDREPWCFAPTTFHHVNRAEFEMLWEFEQEWITQYEDVPRFRDIFNSVVLPKLKPRVEDWDNLSSGMEYSEVIMSKEGAALDQVEQEAHLSFDHCQDACLSKAACLQFSYNQKGVCFISNEVKLGHEIDKSCLEYSDAAGKCTKHVEEGDTVAEKDGITSGWIMTRVAEYVRVLDESCLGLNGKDWIIET
ncbi:hypothetical protein GGR57DRAFT_450485 [Xylariaceae sp. FL1272]|nr:hypothetical protein GGR57DRAFT_450485 [Xylariaceae sp. FL1272]